MSFAHETKMEICRQKTSTGFGYTWGLLLFGSAYSTAQIGLHTEHRIVAKRYAQAVSQAVPMEGSVTMKEVPRGGRRSVFTVSVDSAADRARLLERFPSTQGFQPSMPEEAQLRGFLTGAYLSCGNVWEPQRGYRAEFLTDSQPLADVLSALLEKALYPPKQSLRRNSYLLYYTDSAQVEDLLTYVGAVKCVLRLMDVKILRDVRNQVNRRTNCDTANISKTVEAAMRQCQCMERLKNSPQWESLDAELREIALLRLDNPQASLRELCELLPGTPSRSTLNRRLARLLDLADQA